ncbi:MAG: hypothetical protein AABX16_02025 [Nanoarchaeota archaeon]
MPKKSKKLLEENKNTENVSSQESLPSQQQSRSIHKKKSLTSLIILIMLLIIVDALSIAFYFQKDIYNSLTPPTNSSTNVCVDGTPYDECSINKPKFCYNGELVNKAFTCGCPEGYTIEFQSCKKL